MISQKAKYALRALLALAELDADSISSAELAERERIPRKFLEQILADLKRDGILQSRRGAAGGYSLLKPADTITFGHVLRLIEAGRVRIEAGRVRTSKKKSPPPQGEG